MEISSSHQQAEAGEMPIPINSAPYGDHGSTTAHHMIHHHHHDHQPHNHMIKNNPSSSASALVVPQANIPSSNNNNINGGSTNPLLPTTTNTTLQDHDHHQYHHVGPSKKQVVIIRYRECLKNHAASMGANATDGCGEFMPSGEEGTIEALKCSACNCHRNFHRKEIDGSDHDHHDQYHHHHQYMMRSRNKFILGSPGGQYHNPTMAARAQLHHQHHMIMSYNNVMGSHHQQLPSSDQSDDQREDHDHHAGVGGVGILRPTPQGVMKKRIRTKFTQEQKEKMLNFAEKVGWKIQKQEESVVQQFCQEIGVKRRVLKVWMHNNKHNLAKKIIILPSSN
ncbi:hypothetical protein L484_010980 [Morus notabilis]|uniref:ZF-HD dimerization-type domain-containing protein n=1 Tax=Morus notabilis TaxID=981085 RepID=W9RB40_9ROSA|nr:zinc-finger homeodomain protein 3 [Morus notabilis]EXB80410.1 hypothetical protein L484_010980 [Morus notabilis]